MNQFEDFKLGLKKKIDGLYFENETESEASLRGLICELEFLSKFENKNHTFYIEDGRIVLRRHANKILKKTNYNFFDIIIFFIWLLFLLIFLFFFILNINNIK